MNWQIIIFLKQLYSVTYSFQSFQLCIRSYYRTNYSLSKLQIPANNQSQQIESKHTHNNNKNTSHFLQTMRNSHRRSSYRRRSSRRSNHKKTHRHEKHDRYRDRSRLNDRTRYSSKKDESRSRKRRYRSQSSSSSSSSSSSDSSLSRSSSASESSRSRSASQDSVKVITSSGSTDQRRNASHYKFRRGQRIGHKYFIKDVLGDGTFGRVLKGEYERKNYAIKVIKPVEKYINSARIEKKILKEINEEDMEQKYGIVRMMESFYHRNHFCIVFEELGSSLYQVIKKNKYKGFPLSMVKKFFYQILRSLSFIHNVGYTHTDLKPENILLQKDDFEVRKDYRGTERYYYPLDTRVKVIDFGSATKHDQHHSAIINTRQYRSPEVLLQCCKWNQVSDVWSIGCIIVELYTGNLLFDTHNDYEHVGMMVKNCGAFPKWMVRDSKNDLGKLFDQNGELREKKMRKYVGEGENIVYMKTVNEIFEHDYLLRDLLNKCLELDPRKRISCNEALKHEYFTNFSV